MTNHMLDVAWVFSDGTVRKASAGLSQQLPEDPFSYAGDGELGLQAPPLNLDELAEGLDINTLHARACKQKASDVAGRGFTIRSTKRDGDTASPPAWDDFVAEVEQDERGDESFKERIVMAHQDFESIGWAILEVSRRADNVIDGLWHVPANTVRAHKDGRRFAQLRGGKKVWFKRFGLDGDVDRERGGWSSTPISSDVRGNELIVVRNYTPRSIYYGLPDHVPALAAIVGWRAQAEFNVRFFDNNAVPAYAVVIEGAELTPKLEAVIRSHFEDIKGDPHRTLIIPVPGSSGDEANAPKLRFERLSVEIKEASFRLYKQDNALEICIAHGVPPYRIGWPIVGSLGGSTAEEMTQIYNDSIVQPRQETWEQRLTRALLGEKGLNLQGYVLKAAELDTRNEERDVAKAQAWWDMDIITRGQLQTFFGIDAIQGDPDLDKFQYQISGGTPAVQQPPQAGEFAPLAIAKRWRDEVAELAALRKRIGELVEAAA